MHVATDLDLLGTSRTTAQPPSRRRESLVTDASMDHKHIERVLRLPASP